MLSYRHAFHAGNHADALKHLALVDALGYLVRKDVPLLYADTHAGAGAYALGEGYAAMNREWDGGIAALERAAALGGAMGGAMGDVPGDAPRPVAAYLEAVEAWRRAAGRADAYPGSPALAAGILRPSDRAALFELHPADHAALSALFAGDRRVRVTKADGPASLPSLLPPPSRRGLVLMDPSYELASDYEQAVEAVAAALGRFETGVYLVWYPILEREEAKALPGRLLALTDRPRLRAELRLRTLAPGERGMAGSGIVAINPPWPLAASLREALPWLAAALSPPGGPAAAWSVEER